MGENSKIEWCHHTFNVVWGCTKVSPACANCYAEAWAKRMGFDVWGADKSRRFMGVDYWRQPLKWNRAAESAGERRRVFCSSMADVFEGHEDLHEPRLRLWELIEQTPSLDWLLLTKRPENFHMLPSAWLKAPRPNVWLGTTIENQDYLDARATALLGTPASVHFFSSEPLLGPLDLKGYRPAWVICGGESGRGARPMRPEWARSLRDQCKAADIAFHFKQWGAHAWEASHYRGVKVAEHPVNVGKKTAGRLLDGRTWDEFPSPQ